MAKPEKVDAVNELSERFNKATATVVTGYRGLSVAQLEQLRKDLGEGTTYRVAKNTLVKRATAEAGVEGLDELFVGPIALTFIEGEPVDAAKTLRDFAKDHKALEIKGGYMDGRAISTAEVERIAELDSREVTLGKLAGAMKAKLNETAGLFAAPASQVARMADALKSKKSEGADTESA
ncbi:large subunit ribosomal protein L10 [Saccharopolyspora lacisalsi]|uniref:Large ribosomal subunit protein uL10 n=1 Tax=Halosaccharopolyspora lacisalsi TaxID=1000566 RepID=A0A839DYK7_9PSEU|nr:50S ribosomal protein L10 [Halosaccharopolyspora lacisalsi]MBA8827052.1 large subunit ribosomal protein L10 [Halosaccharopolyspora lacisalsi]